MDRAEKAADCLASTIVIAITMAVLPLAIGLLLLIYFANGGYWSAIFRKMGVPTSCEREGELKAQERLLREKNAA